MNGEVDAVIHYRGERYADERLPFFEGLPREGVIAPSSPTASPASANTSA